MDHTYLAELLQVLREGGVSRYSDKQIQLELYPDSLVSPRTVYNDQEGAVTFNMAGDDPYDDPDLWADGTPPKFSGEK